MNHRVLGLVSLFFVFSGSSPAERELDPAAHNEQALLPHRSDYSFAYWLNGWRKHPDDPAPDILCIETGHYGLTLDLADFGKTRFGLLKDNLDYVGALRSGTKRISHLDSAHLVIEVETGGEVYRAVTCKAAMDKDIKHLKSARMWESGKLVQHFDLLGLVFKNDAGRELACNGTLDIVAWPSTLTLNLDISPNEPSHWNDARMSLRLKGNGQDWHTEQAYSDKWPSGKTNRLSLTCNLNDRQGTENGIALQMSTPQKQSFPPVFEADCNAYVARVKGMKRPWKTGYTDIRNYDEFELVIENTGNRARIPFLLNLSGPANITGLCPILCDENGVPTGIPIQLSKNWHYKELGAYLRAYALIPAQKGTTRYKIRITYGFYGTLPSASHAQLSLIGYGGNGRWEQLAIGCWGETMCLDMDMSLVDVAITDVRMLMTRNGPKGEKWKWSDGGWGGDWLNVKDAQNRKLYFSELKTAYIAHGPCLTEVRYDGFYGSERSVDLRTTVRTLRTDDYARTFQTFRYTFRKPVSVKAGWLFKMGKTRGLATPEIAYGNEAGLLRKHAVPNNLTAGEQFVDQTELTGDGPWWVAFPGAHHTNDRDWGTGSRALVIRSYQATIDGKKYNQPSIAFPVFHVKKNGRPNLDLLLTPPAGINAFNPGDSISFEVEWITVPRIADDYYGPNDSFRSHLNKYPRSWKTVYREAKGNDLEVQVVGGEIVQSYPIIIQTTHPKVQLLVNGGIGMVPVRFDGLATTQNYALYQVVGKKKIKLDQSVHGNDFWQTDYDPKSKTYSLTFNLPLDNLRTSRWILIAE